VSAHAFLECPQMRDAPATIFYTCVLPAFCRLVEAAGDGSCDHFLGAGLVNQQEWTVLGKE